MGKERIANELLLKPGLRISPRTVRKYMQTSRNRTPRAGISSQAWQTFVRNHAQRIMACDFCVVVTTTFRILYIFVVMADASRKILHVNVTAPPRRNGRYNSFAKRCHPTIATASCSMITLDTIPGVDQRGAERLVAEWGTDMRCFETASRLAA